ALISGGNRRRRRNGNLGACVVKDGAEGSNAALAVLSVERRVLGDAVVGLERGQDGVVILCVLGGVGAACRRCARGATESADRLAIRPLSQVHAKEGVLDAGGDGQIRDGYQLELGKGLDGVC